MNLYDSMSAMEPFYSERDPLSLRADPEDELLDEDVDEVDGDDLEELGADGDDLEDDEEVDEDADGDEADDEDLDDEELEDEEEE